MICVISSAYIMSVLSLCISSVSGNVKSFWKEMGEINDGKVGN